jgi:hypothetical protein
MKSTIAFERSILTSLLCSLTTKIAVSCQIASINNLPNRLVKKIPACGSRYLFVQALSVFINCRPVRVVAPLTGMRMVGTKTDRSE